MKRCIRNAGLISAVTFLLLFAVRPTNYCGSYFKINRFMGALIDCDSYQYVLLSIHPGNMLSKNIIARRQNRPLYIATTYLIGKPIQYVLITFCNSSLGKWSGFPNLLNDKKLLGKIDISSEEDPAKYSNAASDNGLMLNIAAYLIAYIFMNFILLFFSVCVFCSLLEKLGVNVNIINKLVLLLIFNTIVKHFFYSAHEQMFVFLSPLLIFYVLYFKIVLPQKRDNFLITLLFGIACLAYGSFVLYLPCLVLLFMMMDKNAKTIFSKWETYGLHIMLFVFPTVLWIFLCRKFSGHYYNREIEKFREIVWMQDAWSVSLKTFLKMLSMNMLHFLFISLRAILPFALIYFFLKRKNVSEHPSDSLSFNTVVAVCVIVFTLFFSLLGYYAYRLCFFISILFIIAIAKELSRLYQQHPENGKLYDRRLSISIAVWCLLNFVM